MDALRTARTAHTHTHTHTLSLSLSLSLSLKKTRLEIKNTHQHAQLNDVRIDSHVNIAVLTVIRAAVRVALAAVSLCAHLNPGIHLVLTAPAVAPLRALPLRPAQCDI